MKIISMIILMSMSTFLLASKYPSEQDENWGQYKKYIEDDYIVETINYYGRFRDFVIPSSLINETSSLPLSKEFLRDSSEYLQNLRDRFKNISLANFHFKSHVFHKCSLSLVEAKIGYMERIIKKIFGCLGSVCGQSTISLEKVKFQSNFVDLNSDINMCVEELEKAWLEKQQ